LGLNKKVSLCSNPPLATRYFFRSMSDTVIRVENISKLYRLGEVGTGSLAHDVNRWWHKVRGKEDPYLRIGEVNDRTKSVSSVQRPESSAKKTKRNLTTEGTESTEVGAEARLADQAGAAFSNPSTSKLASDSENTSLIRSANAPRSSEEKSDPKALDSGRSSLDSPKAPPSDWVYALKDVSFEVKRGEVLGIIGRNGAGKSTLLKILSRVTTQSSGQIKVKGRIASLLEVGTGFHPELTGRENIFLNGAILGMRKAEIARKFDEIVEFSSCARYIDTPVKRYSSGMYVRLAFAVAAHLEPEILIVDEVLAVGDAEFQKKCLGKMKDVAGHGRTILFVSHNMAAVRELCDTAIYLKNGCLVSQGTSKSIVAEYYASSGSQGQISIPEPSEEMKHDVYVESAVIEDLDGNPRIHFPTGKKWRCRVRCKIAKPQRNLILGIGVSSIDQTPIQTVWSRPIDTNLGSVDVVFTQKSIDFEAGSYSILVGLSRGDAQLQQFEAARIEFEHPPESNGDVVRKYGVGFIINSMDVEVFER
jgi:lipopolysaccharide transport system ATP-binding protein